MKAYLDIVKNIIENGVHKQPTRFENGVAVKVKNATIGTFCEIFRHNMEDGFPLLTCRKLPYKSTRVELEGFIKGITSKRWYQERGCHYWDFWANPDKVAYLMQKKPHLTKEEAQKEEDDLGPLGYSWQWRRFGASYGDNDLQGCDQLKSIVDTLKSNPYDRRMLCSGWNPNQLPMMALPPCHVMWNVVVYGEKLNLVWFQRSNDILIGNPANISSYATLLLLLCKTSGLIPGELVGVFSDAHIYENQVDQARELIKRTPKQLPKVEIVQSHEGDFDLFKWTYEDVVVSGYNPHPPMKFDLTV